MALDPAGLTSRSELYLPGLDEEVTVVKTPRDVLVLRADGSTDTIGNVRRAEEEARDKKWGNFSEGFARYLDGQPLEREIPVAIRYALPEDIQLSVGKHLARSEYDAAQVQLRAAVADVAPRVKNHLASLGFVESSRSTLLPILTGTVPVASVWKLQHDTSLSYVTTDEAGEFVRDGVPNTQEVSGIYDTFNSAGLYANGIRVGIVDQGTCRLYDAHEAFSELSGSAVAYQDDPSLACTSNADCVICSRTSLCIGGQCVHEHATKTASVIASTQAGTKYGAAQVKLYFANGKGSPLAYLPAEDSVACSVSGIVKAYDWFADPGNAVGIVNESYHCRASFSGSSYIDGREADFAGDDYARIANILVTKSAGNQSVSADEEACPYAMNNVCVGGVTSKAEMSCFSSWRNPGYNMNPSQPVTDREEPDLVAFAGAGANNVSPTEPGFCVQPPESMEVALLSSSTSWQAPGDVVTILGNGQLVGASVGTSFAAPAIASIAAFLKSNCRGGSSLDHRLMRAILRTAAYAANPDGGPQWRYSTPGKNNDARDGAGFLLAQDALSVCNETGIDPKFHAKTGSGTIDTTKGDDPPPGECLYGCNPPGPPPATLGLKGSLSVLDVATPPSSPSRYVSSLYSVKLDAGARIRFTVSWDACATDRETSGPSFRRGLAKVKPDFDLFLYNNTTSSMQDKYLYTSQSNDDNNEGFDVVIPAGKDGGYTVFLAWPKDAPACVGTTEGYGWASTVWDP